MERAASGTPGHMLRVLVAGGILAVAWVGFDLVAHSEPAAAAETIDLLPVGDGAVDTVATLLGSVVSDVVEPVVTPVTAPVIETVVKPVVTPILEPVIDQVVTPVLDPLAPVLAPVVNPILTPISPILTVVLDPDAPVLAVLPTVDAAVDVVQAMPEISAITPNRTILQTGGVLIAGAAVIALVVPLLPAPANGGPLSSPLAPAAPMGSAGSPLLALLGELNSGVLAGYGAFGTSGAGADDLPSSPTFASDTTPD